MPVTIADLVTPTTKLMGNRADAATLAVQAIADSIVELSDNYPFEELRENGPVVQFTPGQNQYLPAFFLQPPATPVPSYPSLSSYTRVLNKVTSWFYYLQPPINLSANPLLGNANPGYNLIFRDIEDLEVLVNTLSLPLYWSWQGVYLYVAATPQQASYTYVRYQFKHNVTIPVAMSTDPVLLPNTWYDIVEYAAAERIALDLRMQDVATRYHNILFGDPEFQRSSGARGQPGLIARRTSQTQKNQSRSTRSVTLIRRRY